MADAPHFASVGTIRYRPARPADAAAVSKVINTAFLEQDSWFWTDAMRERGRITPAEALKLLKAESRLSGDADDDVSVDDDDAPPPPDTEEGEGIRYAFQVAEFVPHAHLEGETVPEQHIVGAVQVQWPVDVQRPKTGTFHMVSVPLRNGGQGFGTKLVEHTLDKLREVGMERVSIPVLRNRNERLIAWYEKRFGMVRGEERPFRVTEVVREEFQGQICLLEMSRELGTGSKDLADTSAAAVVSDTVSRRE